MRVLLFVLGMASISFLMDPQNRAALRPAAHLPVQSSLGFHFELPSGWVAHPTRDGLTISVVEDATPHRYGGVYIRKCPNDELESCLVDGFSAQLLSTSHASLGGRPAREYLYRRETAGGTRWWYELVTIGQSRGAVYAVIGHMPPFWWSVKHQRLYEQIRRSFEFVD